MGSEGKGKKRLGLLGAVKIWEEQKCLDWGAQGNKTELLVLGQAQIASGWTKGVQHKVPDTAGGFLSHSSAQTAACTSWTKAARYSL